MEPSRSRSDLLKGALRHGVAGAGLATFWMMIGSLHAGRPSAQLALVVVAGGFVGGLVWFVTGRLKVRGGWWYYARCALIGMTCSLLLALIVPQGVTLDDVLIVTLLAAITGVLVGWYYKDYRPPWTKKNEK